MSYSIPYDHSVRPVELHLDITDGLHIEWADGRHSHFSLAYLRKHCPCAMCREEARTRIAPSSTLSLTVLPAGIEAAARATDARLVGHYAIQISWADGHKTGIYDFTYLRAITPPPAPAAP